MVTRINGDAAQRHARVASVKTHCITAVTTPCALSGWRRPATTPSSTKHHDLCTASGGALFARVRRLLLGADVALTQPACSNLNDGDGHGGSDGVNNQSLSQTPEESVTARKTSCVERGFSHHSPHHTRRPTVGPRPARNDSAGGPHQFAAPCMVGLPPRSAARTAIARSLTHQLHRPRRSTMRTPPYRLNKVTCTPNGTLHRLPSTSTNCRKRLRLAMRDSADADSVVQTQTA
jgi:hypothetical protein